MKVYSAEETWQNNKKNLKNYLHFIMTDNQAYKTGRNIIQWGGSIVLTLMLITTTIAVTLRKQYFLYIIILLLGIYNFTKYKEALLFTKLAKKGVMDDMNFKKMLEQLKTGNYYTPLKEQK